MSTLMKSLRVTGDDYEATFYDGKNYAVTRIAGEAMKDAYARGPLEVWNLIMMEVRGALGALDGRERNIPMIAGRVKTKSVDGEHIILGINHSTMMVTLWRRPPHLNETSGEPSQIEVPWGDCTYV